MTIAQRIVLTLIAVLLLMMGYLGIAGGLNEYSARLSIGQKVAASTEIAYGALSIAALISMRWRPSTTLILLLLWAATASITAGLAPVVWGGATIGAGLASFAGAALICGLVVVGWRWVTRRPRSRPSPAA